MLDLSGPDVWPSTIAKVGEWSRQPCVREGFLTLFDAACLMAAEGYGGIFETCSKATQNEILGLNEALERSVDDRRALEGYLPVNRFVNGEYQDVYPLIAFKYWVGARDTVTADILRRPKAPALRLLAVMSRRP